MVFIGILLSFFGRLDGEDLGEQEGGIRVSLVRERYRRAMNICCLGRRKSNLHVEDQSGGNDSVLRFYSSSLLFVTLWITT